MQYASVQVYMEAQHILRKTVLSDPQKPHAWSKYLFDRWVTGIHPKIIFQGFRYFNVYGPNEEHKENRKQTYYKIY